MSVPPDRMAGPVRDPNKIMGLPKWAFWVIMALGLILAFYIYRRSSQNQNPTLDNTAAGTTAGLTAADIGGTPADNSFVTQTDAQALEEQIQSLQNSLFQLQQTNGGNGAGVTAGNPGGSVINGPGQTIGPTNEPGGVPGPVPRVSNNLGDYTGTGIGNIPIPGVPTEGISVLTGNAIGNSPTAMQNLYAAGVAPGGVYGHAGVGRGLS